MVRCKTVRSVLPVLCTLFLLLFAVHVAAQNPVVFQVPDKPIFVGSYLKVPVRIDPKLGLTLSEMDFTVLGGLRGGAVSPSTDIEFTPERPDLMLLGGYKPGDYVLRAFKKGTTTLLGRARFTVTDRWDDPNKGPSRWFSGDVQSQSLGAAWGGGGTGPQNINVIPTLGTRRILLLMVDTSDQRYSTNATTLAGLKANWLNAAFSGVDLGDGVLHSVRRFYQEVSLNRFDISIAGNQVFGPIHLPGIHDDYINTDGSFKGTMPQQVLTAALGVIDYNAFDTIVMISQPVTTVTPNKAAWPYASIGAWGPYTTSSGNKNYGIISMPQDWTERDGRQRYATLSHEFGHNIGMGDQYTPSVPGRNVGGWDLMHADGLHPHLSLAHRMLLGWVDSSWIKTFNFAAGAPAAPVDQTLIFSPVELGLPPAGKFVGAEIRVADGFNYYLEYRKGQASHIGDRQLPTDSRIVGMDVASAPYIAPISRPFELLLPTHASDNGGVLGNGQFYAETDFSDPVYPTDFRLDASGIDGVKANLRVRYGVSSKPDPSIRPWPASPSRQYQSPDIEVQNIRNLADPVNWFNVPWTGHSNTIRATVKNAGALTATDVVVNFSVKNYNIGGAPETFLGTQTQTLAPNETKIFTFTGWNPPSGGHFCIIVRIPLYVSSGGAVETTELNNLAQSNYTRFISASASPASREISFLEVGNPYSLRTRVFILGGQNNPLYRSYLETTWLDLDPGEVRRVKVMFEYGRDRNQPVPPEDEKYRFRPNLPKFFAQIEDPTDSPRHTLVSLGGAEAEVVTGRKTEFRSFNANADGASGVIITTSDGKEVPGGKVIITVIDATGKTQEIIGNVNNQGFFRVQLPAKWNKATAYYVPLPDYGDCTSATVTNG